MVRPNPGIREQIAQIIEAEQRKKWKEHLDRHPLATPDSCPTCYAEYYALAQAINLARNADISPREKCPTCGSFQLDWRMVPNETGEYKRCGNTWHEGPSTWICQDPHCLALAGGVSAAAARRHIEATSHKVINQT